MSKLSYKLILMIFLTLISITSCKKDETFIIFSSIGIKKLICIFNIVNAGKS